MLHHICYGRFLSCSTLNALRVTILMKIFLVPAGTKRFVFKFYLKKLTSNGLKSKFYPNNHPPASFSWPLAPAICLRMGLHSNRGRGLSFSTGFVWRPLSSYLHPTFRLHVAFSFAFGRTWSGMTAENPEAFVHSSAPSPGKLLYDILKMASAIFRHTFFDSTFKIVLRFGTT